MTVVVGFFFSFQNCEGFIETLLFQKPIAFCRFCFERFGAKIKKSGVGGEMKEVEATPDEKFRPAFAGLVGEKPTVRVPV